MNKIFIGKPIHWLMIIIATAIIFACGFNKMHVSNFNLFISIIFISVAILIVALATVIIRFRNSKYLKIDKSKSNEL